jgi:hypothetical protein
MGLTRRSKKHLALLLLALLVLLLPLLILLHRHSDVSITVDGAVDVPYLAVVVHEGRYVALGLHSVLRQLPLLRHGHGDQTQPRWTQNCGDDSQAALRGLGGPVSGACVVLSGPHPPQKREAIFLRGRIKEPNGDAGRGKQGENHSVGRDSLMRGYTHP